MLCYSHLGRARQLSLALAALLLALPRSAPLQAQGAATHAVGQPSARPQLELQFGHLGGVDCVAFSPDGKTLASGGMDDKIVLWDVASGVIRRVLAGHTDQIDSLSWSPDGTRLASSSSDGTLRLWSARTGNLLRTWNGGVVVAFSPDGKTIAGPSGNSVMLWDVHTGTERRELAGHLGTVYSLGFSPNGQWLAVGSGEGGTQAKGELKLWDVRTGAVQWSVPVRADASGIGPVTFSPDGETIAAGEGHVEWRAGEGPLIQLREARTGTLRRALPGHVNRVQGLAFSLDGQTLVSGSRDHTIRLWDLRTGAGLKTLEDPLDGGGVESISLSPDGRLLAAAVGPSGAIKLWDLQAGVLRRTLGWNDGIMSVAISLDGKLIAGGGTPRSGLRVWDAQTGALKWIAREPAGIPSVAFTHDGQTLVSASNDGRVRLWDMKTRTVRRTLEGEPLDNWVVLSPDDKLLARPTPGNEFAFWELETGEPQRTLPGHNPDPGVAFSPDGNMVATCSVSGGVGKPAEIQLWDARSWQPLRTLHGHTGHIRGIAFSPDSALLAGNGETEVWLWDTASGELRRTLPPSWGGRTTAFAPHRALLAEPSGHDTIRLLHAPTGLLVRSLKADASGDTSSMVFSADERRLVTGGVDHSVRIWDLTAGRLLATLLTLPPSGSEKVTSNWLAITPDGYYDASPGAARFIQWRIGSDLFPVEAYEKIFHRPDLLRHVLATGLIAETPQHKRFAAGQAIPPQVTITRPHDGQTVTGNTIRVEVTVTDDRSDVRVEVRVNGRPVATKPIIVGGKPITVGAKSIKLIGRPFLAGARPIIVGSKPLPVAHRFLCQLAAEVPLPPGETQVTLKAIATDSDALQGWDELHLTRPLAAAAVPRAADLGDLYVLAIGVSRYQNPRYNLKYAAADALAFAGLWPSMQGSLYDHVHTMPLIDTQATAEKIQSELFQLLRRVSRRDSVALFLSGHGVQTSAGEFYFATHDIDAGTPEQVKETALPWTVFETILAKVDARRVFLFLDACHSGSALGEQEASNERLAEALARHGNVLVFSSSRGGEYSYEDPALQHGAFTEALLEGIGQGKADLAIAGKRDGRITAAKLLAYLQARVPELTENRQTPTCPLLYDFGDEFLLARVR